MRVRVCAAFGAVPGSDKDSDPNSRLANFWLSSKGEGWAAWRISWGVWLGNGVFYAANGFDLFAADAFREAIQLGAGQFLTKARATRGLLTETASGKQGCVCRRRRLLPLPRPLVHGCLNRCRLAH